MSYLQVAMLCSVYYINTNEIPTNFTFVAKGSLYYVTIATVIFYFHV